MGRKERTGEQCRNDRGETQEEQRRVERRKAHQLPQETQDSLVQSSLEPATTPSPPLLP